MSQGDGTFVDVSREAGIADALGKGLGIVLGKFQENDALNLFVANDALPNFFWDIQAGQSAAVPQFTEKGFTTGVALDGDGNRQGCMGVAADDADGDGWLDLFVTNFYLESNTLYLNIGQGNLFQDASIAAGLREPSIHMVGWGTQFIDGDLDGWPDLIVTNGHVDDFTSLGQPFAMRPQFFRNLGRARFVEQPADLLGPFFAGEHHGRALARLDWNRDGREDAAIWHIDQPAALLTNETAAAGHFLAVQLRGVKGNRDCIGAIVRAQCGRPHSGQAACRRGRLPLHQSAATGVRAGIARSRVGTEHSLARRRVANLPRRARRRRTDFCRREQRRYACSVGRRSDTCRGNSYVIR